MSSHAQQEVEVDATLVLSRKIKLRIVNGQLLVADLNVFECEEPYLLIFSIETDDNTNESIRLDVFKEDLARELRAWIEGKPISYPSALVPLRVDESMMRFIKFAKTPKQEDLIMWILSRCELYPPFQDSEEVRETGFELLFGGKQVNYKLENEPSDRALTARDERKHVHTINNPYENTATIAAARSSQDDYHYTLGISEFRGRGENNNSSSHESSGPLEVYSNPMTLHSKQRPQSAGRTRMRYGEDMGTYSMTRQLLGKSATLEAIKHKTKGRKDATRSTSIQGSQPLRASKLLQQQVHEQHRVCGEISRTRQDIEQRMDQRRRMIEVARIRQIQAADKYKKIRTDIALSQSGNQFMQSAMEELLTLKKVELEVEEDIKRQRTRVHRGAQRVVWTMAPNGYTNRRGSSQRGPLLGPGPLPPNACSSIQDPRLQATISKFYWDAAGRRHLRTDMDEDESSLVEQAMAAIRRAAADISAFKLDLKAVFQQFDTSGDGFLTPMEMADAFLCMGVKLDVPSLKAIFSHFDPNDSGSVHYGEFVWAFFNRRGLVRRWKRKTEGLTKKQIQSRFHAADINGNGRLSAKEFQRLLKSFGMELAEQELEVLLERFDVDGDGEIDLAEFYEFIESEQRQLFGETSDLPLPATTLPSGSSILRQRQGKDQPRPQSLSQSQRSMQPQQTRRERSQSPTSRSVHNATTQKEVERNRSVSTGHNATAPAQLQRQQQIQGDEGEEDLDVMWMTRMLQAQAEVEARVGKRYYKSR